MNTKTTRSKPQAPAARVTAKRTPAVVTTRKPAKAAATSVPARKSATPRRIKPTMPPKVMAAPPPAASAQDSKQARLITLLRNPAGATLEQMTTLTGWQAHSVRGVISGVLRKRLGLTVACAAMGDGERRTYRIVDTAAA